MVILFTTNSSAQSLKTYFNYCCFQAPEAGPYIETYISVDGQTANWKPQPNKKIEASVLVTLLFYKDTSIVAYSKEIVKSPLLADTSSVKINFLQVKRFALEAGNYNLVVIVDDLNDTIKEVVSVMQVELVENKNKVEISGIEGVESYKNADSITVLTKSNFDIVPNVFLYYPEVVKQILFYTEIYRTSAILGENQNVLLVYYIKYHANVPKLEQYTKYERRVSAEVIPALFKFDISALPTGSYDLGVELYDKKNTLITSQQIYFQRNNPSVKMGVNEIDQIDVESTFVDKITSIDTLCEIIKSLAPISFGKEKTFAESIIEGRDLHQLQQYLFYFFTQRYPDNEEESFKNYMIEVNKVEKEFGNQLHKGYASDRGRVYLQYGPPNSISKSANEPHALPYEIWHYYKLNNQTNRKFVFYNPNLAYNEYYIIHSDAMGEINNSRWRLYIQGSNSNSRDVDATGDDVEIWGSKYNEYFNSPR